MKLKTRKETIINSYDLDRLVQETYGRPFCFQQQEGCQPRGTHYVTVPVSHPHDYKRDTIPERVNGDEMGVSFKAWLQRDPKKGVFSSQRQGRSTNPSTVNLFWERNFYPSLDMVLNDLHEKGLIDAGDYTIDIDW